MVLAIFFYILIPILVVINWLWLAALAALYLSIRYNTMYLIPSAILLDGYFGNFYSVPLLSIMVILWFGLVEFLRPKFIQLKNM